MSTPTTTQHTPCLSTLTDDELIRMAFNKPELSALEHELLIRFEHLVADASASAPSADTCLPVSHTD